MIGDWITRGIVVAGAFTVLVFVLGACDINLCVKQRRDSIVYSHHD